MWAGTMRNKCAFYRRLHLRMKTLHPAVSGSLIYSLLLLTLIILPLPHILPELAATLIFNNHYHFKKSLQENFTKLPRESVIIFHFFLINILRPWINRTTWLNHTFIRSWKITFLIYKVSFWKFGKREKIQWSTSGNLFLVRILKKI